MQKNLRTLIVEDNPDDLEQLKDLLSEFSDLIRIEDVAMTVTEAARLLATKRYELSFLDYELDSNQDLRDLVKIVGVRNMGIPVLNTKTKGDFELTEKLGRILYLPKSYSEQGMLSFITRLQTRIDEDSVQLEKDSQKCFFRVSGDLINIASGDIYFIEGSRNYCKVYCKGKNLTQIVTGTITEVEQSLPPNIFIRCHKSYIINPSKVMRSGRSGTFKNRHTLYFNENKSGPVAYYTPAYRDDLIRAGVIIP